MPPRTPTGRIAEDEGDDQDHAGSSKLERRDVEGQDIGNADHRARNGERQHGGELEQPFQRKFLADQEPGGQEADQGGRQGCDRRNLGSW